MLAIINAQLETISNGFFKNGKVLIENGKIKNLGKNIEIPKKASIIDVENKIVTPGLIEAHSHLGISESGIGASGQDTNEYTNPITPWCNAIDGINMQDKAFIDYRKAGITSVNILPGSANIIGGKSTAIKCKGNIVDEAIIKENTGMKAALGENPKTLYGGKNKTPSSRMGNAALLRKTLTNANNYLKNKNSKNNKKGYDKEAEALLPILKKEIPLRIHCHRADDIVTAIRIAEEFDLKYTLEHITQGHEIIDFIKDKKTSFAIGPTMHYGSKVENKNRNFHTPYLAAKNNLDFAIITDHPVVAGRHLAMSAALAVNWEIDRNKALKAITLSAAKHIGIENRVGSIEIGKDADLVIWSGDPLEFTTFADITIIDGEVVYKRSENDEIN
ncbi:MAG: amidohydrolase [Bacillota bacterium]